MTTTFKPGDRIKCLDPGDFSMLKLGAEYTVFGVSPPHAPFGPFIYFTKQERDQRVGWHPWRFELVRPGFKVGDKVRCINGSGLGDVYNAPPVLGRVYTVTGFNRGTDVYIDDSSLSWFKTRFELAPVPPLSERAPVPPLSEHAARKATPITTGVLDYFPLAMAEVARVSKAGNDQHNPGQELHWDRTKSLDHADCISRHLLDRGTLDSDGQRHTAKVAWRALALLQTELENAQKGKP